MLNFHVSSITNPWKEIKRRLLEFADPAQQLVPAGSLDWKVKKRQPKQPHSDGPPAKKLRLTIHHSVEVPDGYCDDSDEDGSEESGLDEHRASFDHSCAGAEDAGVDSCAVESDSELKTDAEYISDDEFSHY